ncbi:MAG: carboxypeptidase regulatory-like domain-containing protein, partial [Candidatus Acidiferrum sp.]
MNWFLRGILVAICIVLIFAVMIVCLATAQDAVPQPQQQFQISGTVKSGKTVLPGVTVTATNTLTGKKLIAATGLDGSFQLKGLPRGRYVVKIEFMGFAIQTHEVVLNPDNPSGKVDAELLLASRQQEETARANASAASRGFQNLSVEGALAGLSGDTSSNGGNGGGNASSISASDLSSLPMNGAGADVATESLSISGTQGRSQEFGVGNEDELQQRIQEFRQREQQINGLGGLGGGQAGQGGPGGPGGPGGGGQGGFGGPGGGMMIGRMGRGGFNLNQPHGFLYAQDDTAGLDARPYSLSGIQSPKASYNTLRFGSMVGGPLKIPKLFDWSKTTFFTVGWNGSRGSTPFDQFST